MGCLEAVQAARKSGGSACEPCRRNRLQQAKRIQGCTQAAALQLPARFLPAQYYFQPSCSPVLGCLSHHRQLTPPRYARYPLLNPACYRGLGSTPGITIVFWTPLTTKRISSSFLRGFCFSGNLFPETKVPATFWVRYCCPEPSNGAERATQDLIDRRCTLQPPERPSSDCISPCSRLVLPDYGR